MSDFKRQHPVAAITNVLKSLRELLIPIIIVYFLGGSNEGNFFTNPVYITGFLTILLVFSVVQWFRFIYKVEEDEIKVEQGVIVRKRSYIPKHRIQVINISSGVIQRMFGLVSLNVQTAGGNTPGTTISALTRTEAEWIKEKLSKDEDSVAEEETKTEDVSANFALSWKNLFIAGTTSGSFGIALSIVGTIASQMQFVVEDDAVVDYAESLFQTELSFIIAVVIGLILFAWVLSIVGTVLAYANFAVFKKRKEILISRGLFEKKQISIPYSRIQAVRIQEGILRQPFGFCTVYVDSAGYGEESGKSATLFPLIKKKHVWDFIRVMVPEYDQKAEKLRPPKRALRRYIIRALIPVFLVGALLYAFTDFSHYILLLVPAGVLLGYLRFKVAAVGVNDDSMIIRYRNLAKTTAIVKRYRIQAVSAWDNWFQRRLSLKSLSVNIASSDTGATFQAKDFEENKMLDLVEWVEPYYVSKEKPTDAESDSDEPQSNSRITDYLDPGL